MEDNSGIIMGVFFVLILVIVFIVGASIWAKNKEEEIEEEIQNKAKQGKNKLKSLLLKDNFKTEKTAISYTATIHRLYHKSPQSPRPREAGIRSSCYFCEELLEIITTHFNEKEK